MRPRFYRTLIAVAFATVVSPVLAQVDLEVKVMRVDKFEFAPGIVTDEVARRFRASKTDVESRLKGVLLATLSQELSSTKLMTLAVRDESLKRLAAEWKVSEELGSGKSEDAAAGSSVDDAHYLAYAKVEDFVVDYSAKGNAAGGVAKWRLRTTLSVEVTTRKTGTKKVLKEDFEENGVKMVEFAKNIPDIDSGMIKCARRAVTLPTPVAC